VILKKHFSFDLSMYIQDFYLNPKRKKSLLGSFSPCEFKTVCSKCNHVDPIKLKCQDCLQVKFNENIFSSLPQEILSSTSTKTICTKPRCRGKIEIQASFNKLILLIIEANKNGSINFKSLELSEIPLELLLPSSKGDNRFYWLQFIQNLENVQSKKYTAIFNMPQGYQKIDSDNPVVNVGSHTIVNPQFGVYFEHENEILVKPIFLNSLEANIKGSSAKGKMINIHVYNMCCFNSFMNPFQRLMHTSISCREFIKKNSHFAFFKLLMNVFNKNSDRERNNEWLQFIYNNCSQMANEIMNAIGKGGKADMATSPEVVLQMAFGRDKNKYSYCSIKVECSKCNKVSKQTFEQFLVAVTVSAKTVQNLSVEIHKKIAQNTAKKNVCQNTKCGNKNNNKQSFTYNKFLFIQLNRLTSKGNDLDFNCDSLKELSFNDIPKSLIMGGKIYKLAFFHNFYPSYTHYTALCCIPSLDSHIEIDDLEKSRIKIRSSSKYDVNPKLLTYICNSD